MTSLSNFPSLNTNSMITGHTTHLPTGHSPTTIKGKETLLNHWHRAGVVDVLIVPILEDNYSYIFVDRGTRRAGCVDPAEPSKILEIAEMLNLNLEILLCTHHHKDHSAGNQEMRDRLCGLTVVGSSYESILGRTKAVSHQDIIQFGSIQIQALYTPCHTYGHMMYFLTRQGTPADNMPHENAQMRREVAAATAHETSMKDAPVLFAGDTIFVGGCGRFLEGSAGDMVTLLRDTVLPLPQNTLLFCGHEYTTTNLRFARTLEPDNAALQAKYEWAKAREEKKQPTIPSSLAEERTYNPFMRLTEPSLCAKVPGGHHMTPAEMMGTLRAWKNIFK